MNLYTKLNINIMDINNTQCHLVKSLQHMRTSNELQWLDMRIGYQINRPSDNHQGDDSLIWSVDYPDECI